MNPNAAPVRKQNKRREKEVVILQAAEKIFAEEGFGGATMQLIADAAQLPKANVHYYFSTKEELYRQVVSNIFDVWLQAAGSFEESDGPAEGIGAYIDAKMEISRTRPAGSKVWASEVMHGAPIIQDYLETTLVEWTNSRIQAIEAWIAAGLMDPISPRHLLYMIWATTQHYADFGHQIQTLNHNSPLSEDEWNRAKDSVKTIILKGIGVAT
ncbi:TetR/AcrR family transcriptional regulator [Neptunicoccus cionae]|uniref:TetR family transcriptional regulator n=1 Tax=Neptunicoccus cionae TaxID=2035344 RepID=A0A916VP65_9RHOB|nr:TetR/AcrR family transcriptional regulator [Amylibacter cionae]GGA15496.1 TetR family transcriptional regulator [Amylibacter cionae]